MEVRSSKERLVELKICERCGGLWLRPGGSTWAYCGPCKGKMDELPAGRRKTPIRASENLDRAS